MQTVSFRDSLYEMLKPIFLENRTNTVNLSVVEFAHRVAKGKRIYIVHE